jgi:hypothetical protein
MRTLCRKRQGFGVRRKSSQGYLARMSRCRSQGKVLGTGDGNREATDCGTEAEKKPGELKVLGGSRCDRWNLTVAKQTLRTLWPENSEDARDRQFSATMAALFGIGPKDEIEGMIAAQLVAAHNAAMECYRRAGIAAERPQHIGALLDHGRRTPRAKTRSAPAPPSGASSSGG